MEFLRTAVAAVVPSYSTGTISVSANDLVLFYGKSEDARRLDFLNLSETSLIHLEQTCEPEGKLGKGHFAPLLDIERLGLVKSVRDDLLEGFNSERPVKAELSQLNIYGYDISNKPRSESAAREPNSPFGHFVVVLPSEHEGAQQRRRAPKAIQEHAGRATSGNAACIAYASFLCDVEVEVSPVSTGHHVALTYDLFFDDKAKNVVETEPGYTPSPGQLVLETALATLLADPEFLPKGGYIGFGLRHHYPLKQLDLVVKDMRAAGVYDTFVYLNSETETPKVDAET
ncbi:hypothetical protein DFH11DRAFT_1516682 [Phellopilus nigrolimitatus]|nr:hypothetical protein DFH11DRAFT_1516682 [Phellopilus nigrolimitatus]